MFERSHFTLRRAGWFVWSVGLAVFLASCAGPGAYVDAPQSLLASHRLPAEVAQPLGRLVDATLPMSDRHEAALALLGNPSFEAQLALASALGMRDDPQVLRAVVEAVLLSPHPPSRGIAPAMLALLTRASDPLQNKVAQAMGRFDDPRVVTQLGDIAREANQPLRARQGAIAALGYCRTQRSAQILIDLTNPNQPTLLQQAGFTALANLTGIETYGQDRYAWTQWWASAGKLNGEQWSMRLVGNLAQRDAGQRLRQDQTVRRLLESQRALYRTTAIEDRPAVLAYMLNDPIEPIRQLGMDLVLERLLEGRPFDEALRQTLRARLTDPSAALRQQAALRLADLVDDPAADIVAGRLAEDAEHVTSVLKSDLLLMTRLPRVGAVEPALNCLSQESLGPEAAGALASAVQMGLLEAGQRQRARSIVRQSLVHHALPAPQVVTLLGKVGQAADWQRIASWVDSDEPAVKRAAAQAWAESHHSLKLLAERAADPVIQPIVISAATERGEDPFTLLALTDHPPTRVQVYDAWQRALVAMAGRVPAQAVLQAVVRLAQADQPAELREQMLSQAIDQVDATDATASQRILLHLDRAQLRLAIGHAAGALADYRLAGGVRDLMTPVERDRYLRGAITAHLKLGQPDDAFVLARDLLGRDARGGVLSRADGSAIDQFVEYARTLAARQRNAESQRVVTALRGLLGSAIKPEVAQRIALLEAELNSRTPMPADAELDKAMTKPEK